MDGYVLESLLGGLGGLVGVDAHASASRSFRMELV